MLNNEIERRLMQGSLASVLMDFSQIDQYKEKLDKLRPLPSASVKSLRDDLALRLTYHSNAIEGNTLTLQETKVVLEGITIGGKLIKGAF